MCVYHVVTQGNINYAKTDICNNLIIQMKQHTQIEIDKEIEI